MAGSTMLGAAIACNIAPAALVGFFNSDPDVVAMGEAYLRIVSWSFVASGLIFVASSMFQALGNTVPPLLTSFTRMLLTSIPVVLLAQLTSFELWWVWWISVAALWVHMVANVLLLRREFTRRLAFQPLGFL